MQFFLRRKTYFISYLVLLLFSAALLVVYTREEIFFAINGHHLAMSDWFFFCITELGNTWTFIILIILSLFISRRMTIYLLITLLFASAVSQGLKQYVFFEHLRPLGYFQDNTVVHHLRLSDNLYYHSMPSGHSISVFALATACVGMLQKRNLDLLILLFAVLGAYSRVYLGQHFFADIVAGSFIGVFSASVCYFVTDKMFGHERFNIPFFRIWPAK
jgi:membrane-associated phospholipid phosphatase